MARYSFLTKPNPGARVNNTHPLAFGLVRAYLFHEGSGNGVSDSVRLAGLTPNTGTFAWRQRGGGSGGPLLSTSIDGIARVKGLGTDAGLPLGTTPFSCVCRVYIAAGQGGAIFYYGTFGTTGAIRGLDFGVNDVTLRFVGWGADSSVTVPNVNGRWCWFGVSWDGANLRIYEDGRLISGPTALALNTISNGQFAAGGAAFNGNVMDADYDYLYLWNRDIGPAGFLDVFQQPFAVFQPQSVVRRLLVPVSAAVDTIALGSLGPTAVLYEPTLIGENAPIALLLLGPTSTLYAPTLSGDEIVIEPLSLGPTAVLYQPSVSNIDITVGSLGPTAVLYQPSVFLAPKWVFPGTLGPTAKLFAPSLDGGEDSLTVFVGGVLRNRWLRVGATRLESQTRGRWTGTIEFMSTPSGHHRHVDTDLEWFPLLGQHVQITEFGRTLFRGCITEVDRERIDATNVFRVVCRIQDKSAILERRISKKQYTADQDIAAIIRDLHATVLSAPNEGITLDPSLPVSLGAIGTLISANVYASQAADQISDVTGLQWFVDLEGVLRFVDPDDADVAPVAITETSETWRMMSVKETLRDYANSVTVVSNRFILPGDGTDNTGGSRSESYTLLDAGGGIGYQERARNLGFQDGYIACDFVIGSVTSITVDAVAALVVPASQWEDWFNEYLGDPSPPLTFFYFDDPASSVFVWPSQTLSPGDVVVVSYIPKVNNAALDEGDSLTIEEPDEPAPGEQFGTCGSGKYETIVQVNNIATQNELQAYAEGWRDRVGTVPKVARWETIEPGLQVGQKITPNIPRHDLTVSLFITQISMQATDAYDLGEGTCFRSQVTAANVITPSWVKWWQQQYRRSQHPDPQANIKTTTMVLGPGSALIAGIAYTNPGPLSVTGRLRKIRVKFTNPPVDQSLRLQVFIDGEAILPAPGIIVGAGVTSEIIADTFVSAGIYGFVGQYVTFSATYVVTGSAPVAARNGTAVLEWETAE